MVLMEESSSPGVLPDVIQLSNNVRNIRPHHLESDLFLSHDLKPVHQS